MAYILLAEDDVPLARVFTRLLEKSGHEVHMVENGEDGLRAAIMERAPDLLISDIMMPGTDGESLAMVMQILMPETPVIVVTAASDTTLVKRIKEADNVVALLNKPIANQNFIDEVNKALEAVDKS